MNRKTSSQPGFDTPLQTVLRSLTALANVCVPIDPNGMVDLGLTLGEFSPVRICKVSIVLRDGRPRLHIAGEDNLWSLVN